MPANRARANEGRATPPRARSPRPAASAALPPATRGQGNGQDHEQRKDVRRVRAGVHRTLQQPGPTHCGRSGPSDSARPSCGRGEAVSDTGTGARACTLVADLSGGLTSSSLSGSRKASASVCSLHACVMACASRDVWTVSRSFMPHSFISALRHHRGT